MRVTAWLKSAQLHDHALHRRLALNRRVRSHRVKLSGSRECVCEDCETQTHDKSRATHVLEAVPEAAVGLDNTRNYARRPLSAAADGAKLNDA